MLLCFIVLVLFLCFYKVEINLSGFHDDYLSKEKTDSIKGIFIALIVLSHSLQYIHKSGYQFESLGDRLYETFFSVIGQFVVVMFLFYSGYGVYESYKRKGDSYVHKMPKHRILVTLLNFDVATLVYFVWLSALGCSIKLKQCLSSLTSWAYLGTDNWQIYLTDNWYICVILLCYMIAYITLCVKIPKRHCIALQFLLCTLLVVCLAHFKDAFWNNAILCFPLGAWYSAYRRQIETFLRRSYALKLCVMILLMCAVYCALLLYPNLNLFQIPYNFLCIVFAVIVVMITMKLGIKNPYLQWLGAHLFPIFIYMRLSMITMEYKASAIINTQPELFILINLFMAFLIARFYKFWAIRL